MTKKKRSRGRQISRSRSIPDGPLKRGLAAHEDLRKAQHHGLADFAPLSLAFDEILTQLGILTETELLDDELVHLLREAQRWVVEGVDRILSEPEPHQAEESRKLLELEYLLRDFTATPENLRLWIDVESWNRYSKFGFGELRKRQEKRLQLDEAMVVAARDYWIAHSTSSHPGPSKDKRPSMGDSSYSLLTAFGDLMRHAQTVVGVAEVYVQSQGLIVPPDYSSLPSEASDEAWSRMHRVLHSSLSEEQFEALSEPRPRKHIG
jgi:hypothetical protein